MLRPWPCGNMNTRWIITENLGERYLPGILLALAVQANGTKDASDRNYLRRNTENVHGSDLLQRNLRRSRRQKSPNQRAQVVIQGCLNDTRCALTFGDCPPLIDHDTAVGGKFRVQLRPKRQIVSSILRSGKPVRPTASMRFLRFMERAMGIEPMSPASRQFSWASMQLAGSEGYHLLRSGSSRSNSLALP
jgi:hypothetical protein